MRKILSNLLLDSCHLTNIKLVFIQVNLLKVKTYLNKTPHENIMPLTKEFSSYKNWENRTIWLTPPFQNLLGLFRTVLWSAPSLRWMNPYYMTHLSGFLILFTFEQNNSCLTKLFIQSFSKIFTPLVQT